MRRSHKIALAALAFLLITFAVALDHTQHIPDNLPKLHALNGALL